MKITRAEFMTGAAQPGQFPPPVLPEVAFAGKSNVGKSSLMNTLLNRKHLVKTSATPGKTQEVNFFRINDAFVFVDLPGYGYAAAPRAKREGWSGLITAYAQGRPVLRGVVVILDVRHAPSPLDEQLQAWLAELGLPALYVANKADKLKQAQLARRLHEIATAMGLEEAPLACSAQTGLGRRDLWGRLGGWLRAGPATARSAP